MKVFGLGLSKTGTCSLNTALNILGIRAIHGPHDEVTKAEIMAGKSDLSILSNFDAITDIPMALRYVDLDQAYPGSKFILTCRGTNDWLESMRKHYARRKITAWNSFIRACAYGCVEFNAERLRIAYDKHVNDVWRYFSGRPDDLLVIDVCREAGWGRLCRFLEKPIPSVPFPWENKAPGQTKLL